MAATASIIIEVDDKGATQAFQRINAEAAKLGPTLQPVQRISEQTFNNIEAGALRARESAALVGEEFGVHIPRALRGVIAESAFIGPAFSAAFSGLAVIGFIEIAVRAVEQIRKVVYELSGAAEAAEKFRLAVESSQALDRIYADSAKSLKLLRDEYDLIGLKGIPLAIEKQRQASAVYKDAQQQFNKLSEQMKDLQKQAHETEEAIREVGSGTEGYNVIETVPTFGATLAQQKLFPSAEDVKNKILPFEQILAQAKADLDDAVLKSANAGKQVVTQTGDEMKKIADQSVKDAIAAAEKYGTELNAAVTKARARTSAALSAGYTPEQAINADLRAKQEALANELTFFGEEETFRRTAAAESVAIEKEASDKRLKLLDDETSKAIASMEKFYDEKKHLAQEAVQNAIKQRRIESETEVEERNAAIALAPPWERANAQIVEDFRQRMEKIQEMEATGEINSGQRVRREAAALTTALAKTRDEMANQMETLFDDITSGNIGKAFLTMFKHMVFQMLATWIMGLQGMRSASQSMMSGSGGGGLLGSIFGSLGGIFGGGGGGGSQGGISGLPGVITNLTGESSSNSPMTLIPGLGLSAGVGGTFGTTLPSGAVPGDASGIGGILGMLFKGGGGLNSLLLTGGLALGMASFGKGGAGGILGSAAAGAMIGSIIPGIGSIIGAGIGALVGLFSSLFGEHKGDKARKEVIEPLDAQIKILESSYDVFQTDYNSSVTALEQMRGDAIAALRKIGGRQVKGNTKKTNDDIDAAELYLKTTEAERQRRAQTTFGPAQFQLGGFVHPELAVGMYAGFPGNAPHFFAGGAVPAILHANEFVMQASAVKRIGPRNLAAMNNGGAVGGTNVQNFNVTTNVMTMDSKSFREWLRDGGLKDIVIEMQRANRHGGV